MIDVSITASPSFRAGQSCHTWLKPNPDPIPAFLPHHVSWQVSKQTIREKNFVWCVSSLCSPSVERIHSYFGCCKCWNRVRAKLQPPLTPTPASIKSGLASLTWRQKSKTLLALGVVATTMRPGLAMLGQLWQWLQVRRNYLYKISKLLNMYPSDRTIASDREKNGVQDHMYVSYSTGILGRRRPHAVVSWPPKTKTRNEREISSAE